MHKNAQKEEKNAENYCSAIAFLMQPMKIILNLDDLENSKSWV